MSLRLFLKVFVIPAVWWSWWSEDVPCLGEPCSRSSAANCQAELFTPMLRDTVKDATIFLYSRLMGP